MIASYGAGFISRSVVEFEFRKEVQIRAHSLQDTQVYHRCAGGDQHPGDHCGNGVCNQASVITLICSAPRLSIPRRADAHSVVQATIVSRASEPRISDARVFIMC